MALEKINLSYFDLPALAEPIKMLAMFCDCEFVFNKINSEEFVEGCMAGKWTTLPNVEATIDGEIIKIEDSLSTLITLAPFAKLLPEDKVEQVHVLEQLYLFHDLASCFTVGTLAAGAAPEMAESITNNQFSFMGRAGVILKKLNSLVETGFCCGDKLSVADLTWYSSICLSLTRTQAAMDFIKSNCPNIFPYLERVKALPEVQKYLESVPTKYIVYHNPTEILTDEQRKEQNETYYGYLAHLASKVEGFSSTENN